MPAPSPVTDLVDAAGAGVQRILVQRHVEHVGVGRRRCPGCRCRGGRRSRRSATRSPAAASAAAVTATLLNRQNPIARVGVAWCPGGRTAQNAASASPAPSRSTASRPAPAARQRRLARTRPDTTVSASRYPPPRVAEPLDARRCTRPGVDPLDLGVGRRRPPRPAPPPRRGRARSSPAHRLEARRSLRVDRARVVLEETGSAASRIPTTPGYGPPGRRARLGRLLLGDAGRILDWRVCALVPTPLSGHGRR